MKIRSLLHKVMENDTAFWAAQHLIPFTVRGYHALLRRFVNVGKNETILDIACGVGDYADFFGASYTGVDINPAYIVRAQQKYPNAKFHAMNCTQLNFPDAVFDHVVTIASLHHLSDSEVVLALSECLRVLKKNCSLHVVDAILPLSPRSVIKRWIFRSDRGRHQRTFENLVALLDKNFGVEFSYATTGLIHDTCYIRIASR